MRFLYVSDFFDEEEEIERIVIDKSKKGSPEEVDREVTDHLVRARLEREKQMEKVQELAEPLAEGAEPVISVAADEIVAAEPSEEAGETQSRNKRSRSRRGRKGGRNDEARSEEAIDEKGDLVAAENHAPAFEMEGLRIRANRR